MNASRRYLLVDDNLAFAENLAEILRDQGDEVAVVSSGEEAVELVQEQKFDALVTDMRMPSMSGALLVHSVRRLDPGLPAIVVTAYTSDDDLRRAQQEGLLAVLPKPVAIGRLLELLALARRDGLVAVVEDDENLIDNLAEALRDRGLTAVTASSVVETEGLGPVSPFAAVVDVCVPGGPAGEALRKLSRRFPGLPLLAITGFPDRVPDEVDAKVYVKPFETGSLMEHLERLHQQPDSNEGGDGGGGGRRLGSGGTQVGSEEEGETHASLLESEKRSGLAEPEQGEGALFHQRGASSWPFGDSIAAEQAKSGLPPSLRLVRRKKRGRELPLSPSRHKLKERLLLVSGERLRSTLGSNFPLLWPSGTGLPGIPGLFTRLRCSRLVAPEKREGEESRGGLR